jgi:hypothetical protein
MAGGGAAGPTGWFGAFSMYREMWAEDPDWTNPGDGNDLTTTRDNGSAAKDWTAYGDTSGHIPHYVTSLIGGQPGFDFLATSNTSGGYLLSVNPDAGMTSGIRTTVIVGRIDTQYSTYAYLVDSRGVGNTNRSIIGTGANAASTWGCYANSGLFVDDSSVDSNDHLFVAVFKTNDTRFYMDDTLIGTDSSGTYVMHDNVIIGRNNVAGGGSLNGAISYYAEFDGDLTAESGYSDWIDEIIAHYGI